MTLSLHHRGVSKRTLQAFTLVELVVAMAVFSLLVVLLAQVVTLTTKAISVNSKKLDAGGQARLVFDRLALDLAGRPRRPDLTMLFTKATGNDSFQFYSQVDGYSGARQIASVGYRIQQTTTGRIFQLERGSTGTDYLASGNQLLFQQPMPAPASTDYEVLSNGVLRLEFCYLLNTGLFSNTAKSDYSDVKALVVAIGVLDTTTRTLISATQLQQLSGALPDNVEGQDLLSGWNTAMAQPTFAAGVPPPAIQNLRVYQRTFCVP